MPWPARAFDRQRPVPARRPARLPVLLATLLGSACTDLDWAAVRQQALDDYSASFAAAVGDSFTGTLDWPALRQRLRAARILWLGDDHRDSLLHQRHLALLARLRAEGFALALGLEAIGTDDQPLVDAWLRGGDELEVLRRQLRQRWPATWLCDPDVDGPFYGELLIGARAAREPVFALEPTPRLPLAERDETIARAVLTAAGDHRDRLLVVVVGQSHLLGQGRLVARTALPAVALGAVPPVALWDKAPPRRPDTFARAASGLLFFADLVPPAR